MGRRTVGGYGGEGLIDNFLSPDYRIVKDVHDNMDRMTMGLSIGGIQVYTSLFDGFKATPEGGYYGVLNGGSAIASVVVYRVTNGSPVEVFVAVSGTGIIPRLLDIEKDIKELRCLVKNCNGSGPDDPDPDPDPDPDGPDEPDTPSEYDFMSMTLAALSTATPTVGAVVFVTDPGREGLFTCRAGTQPSGDPRKGLFVTSNTSGFYWERVWDGIHGKPEWWGLKQGPISDPAILAQQLSALYDCINHCEITMMEKVEYHFPDTIVLNTPFTTMRGETPAWGDGGTRLICTDLTKDVVKVLATNDVALENMAAQWKGDPIIASNATIEARVNAPAAWRFVGTVSGRMKGLTSVNAPVGFIMMETRALHLDDCRTRRDKSLGANDFFVGFWVRGFPRIGAGGNASITVNRCHTAFVAWNAPVMGPTAFYADRDFADTYLSYFESASTPIGIVFDGADSGYAGGHGDVFITHPIIDQAFECIDIRTTNPMAKIQIVGGYSQCLDRGDGNAAVRLRGGNGKVTMSGHQVTGVTGAGNTSSHFGIWVNGQPNCTINSDVIIESFGFPLTIDGPSARGWFAPNIDSGMLGATGKTAVRLTGGYQVYLAPAIAGGVGSFVRGIEMLAANNKEVVVDTTRIDTSACIDGKLFIQSSKIISPGYYTSAGGTNTAGAGIQVTGITR